MALFSIIVQSVSVSAILGLIAVHRIQSRPRWCNNRGDVAELMVWKENYLSVSLERRLIYHNIAATDQLVIKYSMSLVTKNQSRLIKIKLGSNIRQHNSQSADFTF